MAVSATCLPNFMMLQLKKFLQQLEAKSGVGQNFNIFPQKRKVFNHKKSILLKKSSQLLREVHLPSL